MGSIVGRYILPHSPQLISFIGKGKEQYAQATLHAIEAICLDLADQKPDTTIVISPHGVTFSNSMYISGSKKNCGELEYTRRYIPFSYRNDLDLVKEISEAAQKRKIPASPATAKDLRKYGLSDRLCFAVTVPLYFLRPHWNDFSLLTVGISNLGASEHFRFGAAIKEAIDQTDRRVAIIASGELSHHNKAVTEKAEGENSVVSSVFDVDLIRKFARNDLLGILDISQNSRNIAQDCGVDGFHVLLGTLGTHSMKCDLLSYEAPFGIGLMTARINSGNKNKRNPISELKAMQENRMKDIIKNESEPVKLARKAVEYYTKHGKIPEEFEQLSEEWEQGVGLVISLEKQGACRGYYASSRVEKNSFSNEIIFGSIAAAHKNPHFNSITLKELRESTIEIARIDSIEKIKTYEDINPWKHGLLVKGTGIGSGKEGIVLPQTHGIEDGEKLYLAALKQADLIPQSKVEIYRLTATVFK